MEKNKKIQKLTHGDMEALFKTGASQVAQRVKNLPAMQKTWVQSLGWEDPLEKVKATHFSILAWNSMGSQRVGHDRATKHSTAQHIQIHV